MIYSIPFCSVMQIHFPYSLQLYPSTFPGESPKDCPRDITKMKYVQCSSDIEIPSTANLIEKFMCRAILTGCINADYPDLYGHYREARFSQTKHHWWWKTNFVFSKIRILQNYDGIVDLAPFLNGD